MLDFHQKKENQKFEDGLSRSSTEKFNGINYFEIQ